MTAGNPVHEVTNYSAEEAAEGNLASQPGRFKLVAPMPKSIKRDTGDSGEQPIVTMKLAPGRAGISPMNPTKKAWQDLVLSAVIEELEDGPFGNLVQYHDHRSY